MRLFQLLLPGGVRGLIDVRGGRTVPSGVSGFWQISYGPRKENSGGLHLPSARDLKGVFTRQMFCGFCVLSFSLRF